MTRKASAIALAALAAMVFATSASAAPTLSVSTAQQLAKRLALKETRGRNIVAFHVTKPRRLSQREIDFAYDDRSRNHIYCTATLAVALTNPAKGTVTARIAHTHCRPIPSDALAFEAATARALRQVHAKRGAVNASLAAFRRTLRPCAGLRVPRADRTRVRLIVSVAGVEALERPVDAQVASFVTSLGALRTTNATLAAARAGWSDYVGALHALPRIQNACATIKSWARRGYGNPAPVDFVTLERLNTRTTVDGLAIAKAARLLAADGVFPQDVVAFTPGGLLLQLSIKPLISGIG